MWRTKACHDKNHDLRHTRKHTDRSCVVPTPPQRKAPQHPQLRHASFAYAIVLMATEPAARPPFVVYDGSEAQAPALSRTLQQDVGSIQHLQLSGPSTAQLLVALQQAAVEAVGAGHALPLHTLSVPASTNPWPAVVSLLLLLPTLSRLECVAYVSTVDQGAEQLGMVLQDCAWAPGRLHSALTAAALMQCLEEEEELEVTDMDICTTSGAAAAAAAAGPQQSAVGADQASLLVPGGPSGMAAAAAAAAAADMGGGISTGSIPTTSAAAAAAAGAGAGAVGSSSVCATPSVAVAGQGPPAANGLGTLPTPLQLLQQLMPSTLAQDLTEGTTGSSSTADVQTLLASYPAAAIFDVASAAAARIDFSPPLIKQRRGGGLLPALGALLLPILQQTAHLPPLPLVQPVPLVMSDHPALVDLTLQLQHEQPWAAPGRQQQQQQQRRLMPLHGSVLQQLPHTLKRLCLTGCSACSSSSSSSSSSSGGGGGGGSGGIDPVQVTSIGSSSNLDVTSSAGGREATPGCCCLELDLRHLLPLTALQELVLSGVHVRSIEAVRGQAALESVDLNVPLPAEPDVWDQLLQQGWFLVGLGPLAGPPPPPVAAGDLEMVTKLTTSCGPRCGLTSEVMGAAAEAGGGFIGAAAAEGTIICLAMKLRELTLATGSSPPPHVLLGACSSLRALVALEVTSSRASGWTEAHVAAVGALTQLTRLALNIPTRPPPAAATAAAAWQPFGDASIGGEGMCDMGGPQEEEHLGSGAALAAVGASAAFGSGLLQEAGLGLAPLDGPSWLDPPLQQQQQQQLLRRPRQQQQANHPRLQVGGILTAEAWAQQLQRLRGLQHLVLPAELLAAGGTWLTRLTSLTHLGFTHREGRLPTAAVEHLAASVQQGALQRLRQVACMDTSGVSNVQLLSLREIGVGADLQLLVGGRKVWRCAGSAADGPQYTS